MALLAVLTLGCIGVLAPAAQAAKPVPNSGGSSSTLELVLLDSPDAVPNYGEHATFNVSTTATSKPMVQLDCYQGGTRVYGMSAGFYADYPFTTTYTLRSSNWTGGAADCTARLYYASSKGGKTVILKTLSFIAEA
jgi:hypothetical protein